MKKRSFAIVVALVGALWAFPASGGDAFNAVWDVNGLFTEDESEITALDLDIEIGPYWLALHGVTIFFDGLAGATGTGYVDVEGTAYFHLNVQSYSLVVSIDVATGLGIVDLYDSSQRLVDSGTLSNMRLG